MARMARLVVPDYPHHVTQRGNRRQRTFFCRADYRAYLAILAEEKRRASVGVWAYCLMPNHVHLIVVPESSDGLSSLFRDVHRRYTTKVNKRFGWKGHLWQERFHSCVLDENHLLAAARYVELNPVRAGLCRQPGDWPWSSARPHISGCDDQVVSVGPLLRIIGDWGTYLKEPDPVGVLEEIRKNSRTGRPLGDHAFIQRLETISGRNLRVQKPGPKAR
jgi:putative transposase